MPPGKERVGKQAGPRAWRKRGRVYYRTSSVSFLFVSSSIS